MKRAFLIAGILMSIIFSACEKESDFHAVDMSEYYPLQVGKYIVYDMDSLVVTAFGKQKVTVNYQAKFAVEEEYTDGTGHKAYNIVRYIRKTAADAWTPDNSFQVVDKGSKIEFVEENKRFIKLSNPVNNGFSWKGNSYIDIDENNIFLKDWDYVYDSVNVSATVGSANFDSTITINQRDELLGDPNIPSSYSEYNYSIEKYAKGIGMIYRDFIHMVYQPDQPNAPNTWYYEGYGIRLTMIEHN